MCDMMAYREGRQPGSEHIMDQTDEHRPAAEQTGPYYDAYNFARLIRTPIRIMHGLADDNCHTVGGIAAFNSIPSKDKKLLLIPGLGHRWIKTEFEQWLFE
jgi:cephalosporin-C deacetylase-like acetyl esterase